MNKKSILIVIFITLITCGCGKKTEEEHEDKIYAEHEDEVEELLWRNRIYTQGIVSATNSQFKDLEIEDFDFGRYILGTYPNREDALKRPLTAMKQDIWEQVIKDE